MPRLHPVSGLALLLALSAGALDAQACLGRPFSTGRVQLGAGAEFGNNLTVLGGDVAIGKDRGVFGRASVAHERADISGISSSDDPNGMTFGGAVGYQFAKGRVEICPVVSGKWGDFEYPGGAKQNRSLVQLGAMFGLTRPSNGGVQIAPFAGVSFAQLSRDVDAADATVSLGTDNYFPLIVGAGFHFRNAFMIIADLTVPVDLGGGDPSFGLRVALPLGRR